MVKPAPKNTPDPAQPAESNTPPPAVRDPEASEFPDTQWQTDEEWVDEINVRWRKVIDSLMTGERIYEAYGKAYEIEMGTPRGYNQACAAGSRLLRNDNFRKLWKKVIEERGFNNEAADWRLLDLMANADPAIQMKAVKHYNELTGRIIKKLDHTSDGKPIQSPAIISPIEPRNDPQAQTEATAGN